MTCEYVVKLHTILALIGLLLLQSCQHNNEDVASTVAAAAGKTAKLGDAAAYNTQLGLAYLNQGDMPRAKRKLLLALSQAPTSPGANASMAYFMEKTGQMDQAQSYYKKAMAAAPGAGAQFNNYGAFLCRRGQYNQAEEYFLKSVRDIKYEHTAGAYENAGLCALAIPDGAKAAKYFSKALEQDPTREQSLYELVNIEMKQEHLNEALAYVQKYPGLINNSRPLLTLAVDVARKAGKNELEATYRTRLNNFSDTTGVRDEYNDNNG